MWRRIKVKVVPRAKKNMVLEGEGLLKVYVKAPPLGGRANRALVEVLAEHYGVKKTSVRVVEGEKSRIKVVEVRLG
jgi:hypothetical protein